MKVEPFAVALQGVGFGPRLVAHQGMRPLDDAPPDAPGSSGGYGLAGRRIRTRPIERRWKDTDDDVLLFLLF